jgi:predicted nucleic acid-binding protein
MKVMFDTSVIISAILLPESTSAEAFLKTGDLHFRLSLDDYIKSEVFAVFSRFFPEKTTAAEDFFEGLTADFYDPEKDTDAIDFEGENSVYNSARRAKADILVTEDKELLESIIPHPRILTPAEFLRVR